MIEYLKTFRFQIELDSEGGKETYHVHDATVTWDSRQQKCIYEFSSAVPTTERSTCAQLFSDIDCSTHAMTLTIQSLNREQNPISDSGTVVASFSPQPLMSLSRSYNCAENEYLMDTLIIELYGQENPF